MARPKKTEPAPQPVLGTITWLGEGEDGPRSNEWNGITFAVGKSVEITDAYMMKKAKTNRFYEVDEHSPPEPEPAPEPVE